MKLRATVSIALALATLSPSLPDVQASTVFISREEKRDSEWVFKKGSAEDTYQIVKNYTQVSGAYHLASHWDDEVIPFAKEDMDVPGTTSKGHATLKLTKEANGLIYLHYDVEVVQDSLGKEHRFETKEKIEVCLIEGSWQDYLNGRVVRFKASESGEKAYLASREKMMEPTLALATEAVKSMFGDSARFAQPRFSELKFSLQKDLAAQGLVITASQYTLNIKISTVESKIVSALHVKAPHHTAGDGHKGSHADFVQDHFKTLSQSIKSNLGLLEMSTSLH